MSDKARYLITTADERTWDGKNVVLFLGKWCLRSDRKILWSGLDAIIAEPYGIEIEKKLDDYEENRHLLLTQACHYYDDSVSNAHNCIRYIYYIINKI